MGYDLIGGLFFAAVTPLIILGFIAFWRMTNRERAFIEDQWERYAAARGREYFPARGEWPNRTSPGVRWRDGGITYELTVIGVEAGARTRLAARPRAQLHGSFALRFDGAALDVSEEPAGLTDLVLHDDPRRALFGFRQRDDVTVKYRRGRVVLEWPGREANEARIDEATRVVGALATALADVRATA